MGAEIVELEKPNNEQTGYAVSRFNAMRHGILSRHTILPWENQSDYDALLADLEAEYSPSTATESHLVEELAGIMWRKARVRVAEGSIFRKAAADEIGKSSVGVPAYINAALVATDAETKPLKNGVRSLGESVADDAAKEAEKFLAYWQERQQNLEQQGQTATMTMLSDEDNADWQEYRKQTIEHRNEWGYEQFPEDKMFSDWLGECVQYFHERVAKHEHAPAIRQQIIGLSYATERMDGVARYETHLDRKFERILAMLLKLKEMNRLKGEPAN